MSVSLDTVTSGKSNEVVASRRRRSDATPHVTKPTPRMATSEPLPDGTCGGSSDVSATEAALASTPKAATVPEQSERATTTHRILPTCRFTLMTPFCPVDPPDEIVARFRSAVNAGRDRLSAFSPGPGEDAVPG